MTTWEAAKALGVGPTTVKRWADEGRLECVRTAGGHRRFELHVVRRFMAHSSETSAAGGWVEGWIKRLQAKADPHLLHAALLEERARAGSWWETTERLGQVIAEIGERWQRAEYSIAEEHLASNQLFRLLTTVSASLPTRLNAPRCLLASAEGDPHTLGLALAELCAREAGWECVWLGAPTPREALVQFIRITSPKLVALSGSAWSKDKATLDSEYQAIANACRASGSDIVLGGMGAWPDQPDYGYRVINFEHFHKLLIELAERRSAR